MGIKDILSSISTKPTADLNETTQPSQEQETVHEKTAYLEMVGITLTTYTHDDLALPKVGTYPGSNPDDFQKDIIPHFISRDNTH